MLVVVVDAACGELGGQVLGAGVVHVGEEHHPEEGAEGDGHDAVLLGHQAEVERLEDRPDGEAHLEGDEGGRGVGGCERRERDGRCE